MYTRPPLMEAAAAICTQGRQLFTDYFMVIINTHIGR